MSRDAASGQPCPAVRRSWHQKLAARKKNGSLIKRIILFLHGQALLCSTDFSLSEELTHNEHTSSGPGQTYNKQNALQHHACQTKKKSSTLHRAQFNTYAASRFAGRRHCALE